MLSYGLFPERSYFVLVAEALGIAKSEAAVHTVICLHFLTALTTGALRLSEDTRKPVRFPRELLLRAFERMEAIGMTMTGPLWVDLDRATWVTPDAKELKVEYETYRSTGDVCEEMKSQASLWKLQFSDSNHPRGEH